MFSEWITVIETAGYLAQSKALSETERDMVVELVARDPECGDVIPDTGGLRKLRVPAKGHGKRGGGRVIYYYLWDTLPIYLMGFYPKNERADLTPAQKKAFAAFAERVKKAAQEKKR